MASQPSNDNLNNQYDQHRIIRFCFHSDFYHDFRAHEAVQWEEVTQKILEAFHCACSFPSLSFCTPFCCFYFLQKKNHFQIKKSVEN